MMAFTCTIEVPRDVGEKAKLKAWLTSQRTMIAKGDALFAILDGDQERVFCANMPGLLAELLVQEGVPLKSGQAIAVVWVEGEHIPYGRPYISEL